MSWAALAAGAPELARRARERLELFGVAMLATVRADGSPRLDPIEPFFVGGELLLGVGARTRKARDLRRDPRCALHAVVTGANAGEPDVKFRCRVEPSPVLAGWWAERPADADVYRVVVEEAVTIEWDLAGGRMRVRSWSLGRGERVEERDYP